MKHRNPWSTALVWGLLITATWAILIGLVLLIDWILP